MYLLYFGLLDIKKNVKFELFVLYVIGSVFGIVEKIIVFLLRGLVVGEC